MADLSVADIIQQYSNTTVLYRGKPVKVKGIGKELKIKNLLTQKTFTAPFSFKTFSPPQLRLGFVNIDDTVVYVCRLPVRIMQVGLSQNNCSFSVCKHGGSKYDSYAPEKIHSLEQLEVGLMMLNHYPSFDNALEQAKEYGGCVAFDKQFAIDNNGQIFYKNLGKVGTYWFDRKLITWNANKEYLQALMKGGKYEQSL